MTQSDLRRDVPVFTIVSGLVLTVIGLGVSIYLTIEHYNTSIGLSCPDTGRINCQKVTTSHYSEVLGIPVAVLGTLFFVVCLALLTPAAWRSPSPVLRWSRIGWLSVGMLMVFYLVWAEFWGVSAICLWCTSVHIITFLLFLIVAFTEAWMLPPVEELPDAPDGSSVA